MTQRHMVLLDVSKRALDTRQAAVSSDKWNIPNKYLNACEFLSFQVSKREMVAVSVESQLPCGQNFRESSMSFFTPSWMPRATPVPEEAPVKIIVLPMISWALGFIFRLSTEVFEVNVLFSSLLVALTCFFRGCCNSASYSIGST